MADASDQETPPRSDADPFSAFSDNLLGAVLLRVACNGVRFGGQDSPMSDEDKADTEKKIDKALIEPLPSESAWLVGNPEAPGEATIARSSSVKCSSSLISFRHALVCKRWLRVARFVHPAIVVPLDRFFSARALASLLRAPATAGFPNLRHLHLAPNALDTVDSALVRAICAGSGPSLTHLSLQLHDAWLHVTRARQYPPPGVGTRAAEVAEAALAAGAISPADVAALFWSCTRLVSLAVNFGKGISEVPSAVSCLQQLTKLSMSFREAVITLPSEFGSLVRLKRLQIISSSLVLPDSFSQLPALEHIQFSRCEISHLPSGFGQLRNLKILSLQRLAQLVELPASICLLSALTSLTLFQCYKLAKLPKNFHQLANLRTLHLEELIALTALPVSLGQLPALRELKIIDNGRITHLPPSLSASHTLERLSLHNCLGISSLPDVIGHVPTLERVDLSFLNTLITLPDSLGRASRLHELRIVGCSRLVGLPRSVSAMCSLARLTLDDCAAWALPEDFGQLSNLVRLKLSCERLTALPRSFGQLGKLQELRLHACYGLVQLPECFANLSSLETLAIYGGTLLTSLPPNFEQLPQLRHLELFNCAIPRLPKRFGQLPKLEVFKVGSTDSFTRNDAEPGQPAWPPPTALTVSAQDESASMFMLMDDPLLLDQLDETLLGRCLLFSFPMSFTQLTSLQQLAIDGCDALEGLPFGLGYMAGLQVLRLKNCPQLRSFMSLLPSPPPTSASAQAPPLPMLHSLEISNCPSLTSLPRGLDALPRLERVTLDKCSKLGFANQLSAYHRPSSTPHAAPIALPPSITTVSLLDVFPVARYLPDSFLTLSRLTHLNLHHLNSLQALFAPRPHGARAATAVGELEPGTEDDQVYGFPVNPQAGQPASLTLLSSLQHLAIVSTRLPLLPSNLSDLRSLKVLILERCICMPSLPDSLPHLPNLEKLVLSTLPRLARLPKNLGQLKALKELTVEACDALTGLPASIGLLSSLVLLSVIECDKFSSLPDSIGSLPRLASLKLNCCFRLRRLPESISRLPALVILSLEDCEKLQALPDGLAGVGTLREHAPSFFTPLASTPLLSLP
ncbi:unnamed protein product [Closterium sp. Naga37s-1]|nr:unnamed protein product [Closterium sp. Naga37s-1]